MRKKLDFEAFVEELNALCKKHDIGISGEDLFLCWLGRFSREYALGEDGFVFDEGVELKQ